ncbi:ATP-binding protein [Janthinobacterium sp. CG23_2]|uniref:ATP-binding protein n=1 Tax=Massilia antarctica TaxID=2765360 RepID=UPI0006BB78E6|nr:ATP-binding protein [Massilia sp. H27-R4]CUI08342.1 Sensory box histidine kinase [Janthinobacterium sp. CG23_2]CUU32128.1 Sensory box histidine kinase [Janthinobacterium sp. CG23_2]
MEMFTVDVNVAQWESALPSLRGMERLPVLLPLAWHLRQRDPARALMLAGEALSQLPLSDLPPDRCASLEARMHLLHAECEWLDGALDLACAHARELLSRFTLLNDHAGCADTYWLLAWISIDRGDHDGSDTAFANAAASARQAGDALRTDLAEAALARWAVLRDPVAAIARWGQRFDADSSRLHPSLATWVNDFLGLAASQAADFGAAAAHYMRCYESALDTGQVRAAITAATNIGEDFTILNDHHSALEWVQCALELARPTGWPRSVGACLMHSADSLRRLGQLDAAHDMLQEALTIMKPLENARSYAIALQYLGDLSLDKGDYEGALDAFTRLAARAEVLDQADFRSIARRGQAHALSHLGRAGEAIAVAADAAAMAAAPGYAYNQIAALRVMALIHAQHPLPPPPGMVEPNPVLHYLQQALSVASTIEGYTVPGDLYDAMAREYAAAGDYARAYEVALAASSSREKTHSQEATNRAIAMQVHHQTEHARSEGYHHRELAESEARRAEILQRTSATLERLSAIGQEITAHLDAAAVFQALDRHIHGLLTASTFAIYLIDAAGTTLHRAFGVELGRELPSHAIALSKHDAYSVRCLDERREIYIEHWPDAEHRKVVPGTMVNMSALFVPLTVGERAIGVMTVQAPQSHAYGENERMIFRTLCAYGAIALDNAEAYRQLQDAQTQLVSQEKLAALGSLMAGVAHELNTPIGNSLLIASTMQEKTAEIEALMKGPGLRRSELAAFITDSQKAAALVLRGLTSAADLVNSFKQVAVDRTTEQRRFFNLQQVCHEIIATMMNRIRAANHNIDMEVSDAIGMDSYPGPFGQVITNFINNALLHAFAPGHSGHMQLTASMPAEGRVLVEFHDNGGGIRSEHLGRIFDPFFTTKLGQGGSGLGLSISYNIVTSLLGGQITVVSSAQDGTSFVLDLPLTAPQHPDADVTAIY